MAGDEELVGAHPAGRPGRGCRTVVEEGGIPDLGIDAVVGNDGGDPTGRQRLSDEEVVALGAGIPRAAVEENHRLAVGTRPLRRIDVEFLPRVATVRNVRLELVALSRNGRVQQRCRRAAAEQAENAGDEASARQRHAEPARSRTCSASASEAVRPGDSMPNRLMRPGTPWSAGPVMVKSCAGAPCGTIFGRMPA